MNKRVSILLSIMAAAGTMCPLSGHDVITTKLTWAREVSRVVFARCAGCHRPDGRAFSLLKYDDARPWAKAIQEEVLHRRMPPWNAVKGFGEFKHDLGLSEEEIHLLADWVEGGAPEGDPNLLPTEPRAKQAETMLLKGARIPVLGSLKLLKPVVIQGIEMGAMDEGRSFKLVAEQADGTRIPLIWIEGFSPKATSVYELREPAMLQAGTRVIAYPQEGVAVRLITGSSRKR